MESSKIYGHFINSEPIIKGWSEDKKYCVTVENGTKYLLRVNMSLPSRTGDLTTGYIDICYKVLPFELISRARPPAAAMIIRSKIGRSIDEFVGRGLLNVPKFTKCFIKMACQGCHALQK